MSVVDGQRTVWYAVQIASTALIILLTIFCSFYTNSAFDFAQSEFFQNLLPSFLSDVNRLNYEIILDVEGADKAEEFFAMRVFSQLFAATMIFPFLLARWWRLPIEQAKLVEDRESRNERPLGVFLIFVCLFIAFWFLMVADYFNAVDGDYFSFHRPGTHSLFLYGFGLTGLISIAVDLPSYFNFPKIRF